MLTYQDFQNESHIDDSLIRRTVNQFGGWTSFKESANDVTNHGIDGGFGGFIYYSDTVPFYRRNKDLINESLIDMASDMGEDVLAMVASLNCLADCSQSEAGAAMYGKLDDNLTQVYNGLAWYAAEEVARSYSDLS